MKQMLETIDRRSKAFVTHPLFAFLKDTTIDPRQRLAFIPQMSHFVMTFADLYALVLREEPARDRYQELVNAHTFEDGGHWKWFLADLEKVGDVEMPFSDALRFVWSDQTRGMRLLSYHVCRLGFGASSLRKLALVHAIEASGSIVLEHAAMVGREYAALTGKKLIYFGPHHFESESNHTLEKDSVADSLEETQLDAELSRELAEVVDECFDLFIGCVDEMLEFAKSGRTLGPPATAVSDGVHV
jgi:hypothetical protein